MSEGGGYARERGDVWGGRGGTMCVCVTMCALRPLIFFIWGARLRALWSTFSSRSSRLLGHPLLIDYEQSVCSACARALRALSYLLTGVSFEQNLEVCRRRVRAATWLPSRADHAWHPPTTLLDCREQHIDRRRSSLPQASHLALSAKVPGEP